MASKSCLIIAFVLGLVLLCSNADNNIFSIISYGAKADGVTDDSTAFLKAWRDACNFNGQATLLIPQNTYMINVANFTGPCKGSLTFQIEGTINAPTDPKLFCHPTWISFQHVNNLEIKGNGTLDGQGDSAWRTPQCTTRPSTIILSSIENAIVHHIQSIDSKMFHFIAYGCNNVTFSHVNIVAPSDSPNTDGIHISNSANIHVFDSTIGTGDDCISIVAGSLNINISGVTCSPGHGISIGSLGRSPNEIVKDIHVKNCTLGDTTNGVRIKTIASSQDGSVTTINFEDIIMNNVKNPLIIDQHYCPEHPCSHDQESLVKIKDVTYNNIRGTSNSMVAITFNCSSSVPCQGINLNDINLAYNGVGEPTTASCANVVGDATGVELPPSCLKSTIASPTTFENSLN